MFLFPLPESQIWTDVMRLDLIQPSIRSITLNHVLAGMSILGSQMMTNIRREAIPRTVVSDGASDMAPLVTAGYRLPY